MSVECVFEAADGNTFVPTGAAVGAWDAGIIHGAAVGALLAGRLDPPSGTLARLSIDFLVPVPFGPIEVEPSEPAGGRQVRRQRAVLLHEGREVALGSSVVVTEGRVELPERAVSVAQPVGAGLNTADLFDQAGRFGRSAVAVVLEHR